MFKKLMRSLIKIFPEPLQQLYLKYEEAFWYLFFGVMTTAVSFITAGISKYVLECFSMNSDTVSITSTVISWICAVTFAYVTNRLWVFDSDVSGAGGLLREAASFYGGRVFTLLVETVMVWAGYSVLGINYWVSKIAANVVVLILNYIISKLFVFREDKEENENE